ncbi:hypothetical protein PMAYCL1PPCAC_09459, partial [Pristionchus mayeri]
LSLTPLLFTYFPPFKMRLFLGAILLAVVCAAPTKSRTIVEKAVHQKHGETEKEIATMLKSLNLPEEAIADYFASGFHQFPLDGQKFDPIKEWSTRWNIKEILRAHGPDAEEAYFAAIASVSPPHPPSDQYHPKKNHMILNTHF